jgi:hypothetical protein
MVMVMQGFIFGNKTFFYGKIITAQRRFTLSDKTGMGDLSID